LADVVRNVLAGSVFSAVTLTTAVLAVLLTALTAYYQRRSLWPPNRRLTVTWQRPVALLARTNSKVEGIRVAVNDIPVADPHVVRISVANTGKHDITSTIFDQHRPIQLKFGVPVVRIVDVVSTGGPMPVYEARGAQVRLGPDLLVRSQVIDLQVLTDGRPQLGCDAYLTDTNIELREEPRQVREQRLYQLMARFSWLPAGIAAGAVVGILTSSTVLIPVEGSCRGPDALVATAPPVPAAELPVADIQVDPQTAAPGANIIVTGDDFVIETEVEVIVDCPTTASATIGASSSDTTWVDDDGDFRISLRLPDDPNMLNPDYCIVRAQQRFSESVHFAAASLIVRR